MRATARFVAWWTDDLPPLSGRLRAVFFGGLLLLALAQFSPLTAADNYAAFPSPLLRQIPFVGGLPSVSALRALQTACLVAWLCAIVGFLTRPAMIVLAVTAVALHGASRLMLNSHGWVAPVCALVCLSFASCADSFSLDAVLRRRWAWWPTGHGSGVGATGLPRKLVALVCVHMLFAAGVAKLFGGWGVADGETLRFYIVATDEAWAELPRSPWLASLVSGEPMMAFMAASTLVMELSSPLALWSRWWRHVMIPVWLAFHAGIYLLMLPDFSAQSWCYVLLVDWGVVWAWLTGRDQHVRPVAPMRPRAAHAASAGATLMAAIFLVVIVLQRDMWLLTNVPMYSSSVGADVVSGQPRRDWGTRDGLARLARAEERPWASKMLVWPRVDIIVTGDAGSRSIKEGTRRGQHRWIEVMEELVIQEFASTQPAVARVERELLLATIVNDARRRGVPVDDYRTVDLVYRLDDGPVVLFSSPVAGSR